MNIDKNQYSKFVEQIGSLLQKGREHAAKSVNTILVQTYSLIGQHIVEYEQGGSDCAEYASELLNKLSKDLVLRYEKGFSRSNLIYMRKLYLAYPKSETLSHKLSWSHYFEVLKSEMNPAVIVVFAAEKIFRRMLIIFTKYLTFHFYKTNLLSSFLVNKLDIYCLRNSIKINENP